jgi:Icc-related predicted phosphoesterase
MKICVLSDLHLEFRPSAPASRAFIETLPNDCDVLVLAGDIGRPGQSLAEELAIFCDRFHHVVYVLGNHEYYGLSVAETHDRIAAIQASLPNLHWLDDSAVTIDGQRFIGSTLWFPRHTDDRGKWAMTDFTAIRDFDPWVYEKNAESLTYLRCNLQPRDVLVTHHLPSPRSVHPKYADSPLNKFFMCDIERLIVEKEPALALHGHTHESCDYAIGPTRVVCNPYGYHAQNPSEINPKFNPNLLVTP